MTDSSQTDKPTNKVSFSVAAFAAWAPGIETEADWLNWANGNLAITGNAEPPLKMMPPMLRRRASVPGKMALEVAYQCLGDRVNVPTIFCSRHGECLRSAELITEMVQSQPISPTAFSLSVHNAMSGLFSIARKDQANSIALSAGRSTIEHAVIEACGLLADNENAVLLVVYDYTLPPIFHGFEDCREQPFAWAWLIQAPDKDVFSLQWSAKDNNNSVADLQNDPSGLEILRFFIRHDRTFQRTSNNQQWLWTHHAA